MSKYSLRSSDLQNLQNLHAQIMSEISILYSKDILMRYHNYLSENPHDAIYRHYVELINTINQKIHPGLMKKLEDWAISQDSFVGLARRYSVGQKAEENARMYQHKILQIARENTKVNNDVYFALNNEPFYDETVFRDFMYEVIRNIRNKKSSMNSNLNKMSYECEQNDALYYFRDVEKAIIDFVCDGLEDHIKESRDHIIRNIDHAKDQSVRRRYSVQNSFSSSLKSLNEESVKNHTSKINNMFNL